MYESSYARANGISGATFSVGDPSELCFEVTGSAIDRNPPTVSNVSISAKRVPVGGILRIYCNVGDADGVRSVSPILGDPGYVEDPNSLKTRKTLSCSYDAARGYIEIEFPTSLSMGSFEIQALAVLDKTGHETFVYSSAYAERNGKTGVQTFDVDDAGDVTFDVTAPLYAATKGDGQAYAKDGEAGLTFRFSGPLDEFTRLLVDGTEVSAENYTATRGSTIIELRPSYLDTLAGGGHTVTAVWKDGTATDASFTVEGKAQGEQAGGKTDVDSPTKVILPLLKRTPTRRLQKSRDARQPMNQSSLQPATPLGWPASHWPWRPRPASRQREGLSPSSIGTNSSSKRTQLGRADG